MNCPFLQEEDVLFCQATPFRLMVEPRPMRPAGSTCTSGEYVNCTVAESQAGFEKGLSSCPFLRKSVMRYCSAVSGDRRLTATAAKEYGCGTDDHDACDLFMNRVLGERGRA